MSTKFIKLIGILVSALLVSSPALAAGQNLQDTRFQNMSVVSAEAVTKKYTNPLPVQIPDDGMVEICADPSLTRGQTPGDNHWYMYCTTDPLNDNDKTAGNFTFHLIPMLRSSDLVNWTYEGDAFSAKPSLVASDAGLWAPEIEFLNGQYYLYYTASDTSLPGGGSAIGVETSSSPFGPWVDSGTPVVEPHEADCWGPNSRRWVFDPDVVENGEQLYIFYGSYFGGLWFRSKSAAECSCKGSERVEETGMSIQTGEAPEPSGLQSNASPPTIMDPKALPVAAEASGTTVIVPNQYADPAEVERAKQVGGETVLPAVDTKASDRP